MNNKWSKNHIFKCVCVCVGGGGGYDLINNQKSKNGDLIIRLG